nr:PREDICTED: thyrotropin-releasing hormone-degrading ectoenzyme-like [Linepithema humile]
MKIKFMFHINKTYIRRAEMFIIFFSSKVQPGEYNLRMKFTPVKHNGFFTFFNTTHTHQENKILAATYFQPIGARHLFPCWDEPQIKATFQISITYNEKYTFLSNTLLKNINNESDFPDLVFFKETPEIPVHLLAIAVIEDSTHLLEENIALYYRNKLPPNVIQLAWDVAKKVTKYLESTFRNLEVIGERVNHAIIPNYPDDGMSSWGLILYKESAVIYDESENCITRQIEVANLVARQVAYQWFGNIIKPTWWSDLWLFKSLARFFGADAIHKKQIFKDSSQITHLFIVQNQYESLHLDTVVHSFTSKFHFKFEKSSDIESLSSLPPYRATCIMRMWHHILTNKIFVMGINKYITLAVRQSAIFSDFCLSMEASLFDTFGYVSFYNFDVNIIEIMNNWITQWYNLTQDPVLHVTREYNDSSTTLLNMKFIQEGLDNITIPVTYTTQSNINFNRTSFHDVMWLQNGKLSSSYDSHSNLNISTNDWIIVNLQQTGYYRVNYDKTNWQLITKYLTFDNYANIHVLNRAKLIDDAYHLMTTQQLQPIIFWDLVEYLKREKSYIAWYPMIKALEDMSNMIPYLYESNVVFIKERMALIFSELLDYLTYDESSTDDYLTKCLRLEAIKWACTLGSRECKLAIFDKLHQHIKDPKQYKHFPGWKQWTYCTGLSVSDINVWNQVLDIYNKDPSKKEVLEVLACSENITILHNYLQNMITENITLKILVDPKTRAYIFLNIISRYANNPDLITSIFYDTPSLIPREIKPSTLLCYIINEVYDVDIFPMINNFTEVYNPEIKKEVELKIKQRSFVLHFKKLTRNWNFDM